MKPLFVLFLLFVCLSAAVVVDPKAKDLKGHRIEAKQYRRNAADIRAFHQRAAKTHKNYIPQWPIEPITTAIFIGESEQLFFVSVESGVNSVFVLDASYPSLDPGQAAYNASNSGGVRSGWFYGQTGDMGVYGYLYTDVINFFYPFNQSFGSIQSTYGGLYYDPFFQDISGVLGLAWDPNTKDAPVTPDSALILNLFSIIPGLPRYYVQWLGGEDGRWNGAITSYGSNWDDLCNPRSVVSAPLSFDRELQSLRFELDSFSLGDQTAVGDGIKVDSGLPTILLPWQAFTIPYNTFNPDYDYELGVFTTDCSNAAVFDDFVFVVGGVELRVPATNYIVDMELGGNQCALAFGNTNDFTTPYALGIPFQLSYCTKYSIDDSEISFLLPANAEATAALPI